MSTLVKKFILVLLGVQMFCGTQVYAGAEENHYMGHDAADKVVVAKVNGVEINMAMLMDKMFELAQKKYGKKEISPLVAREVRNDALDEMIVEELAYQKAFAVIGEIPPARLEQGVEELKANHGGEKAFQAYLKKEKITLDEYKRQVARTLTVKLFIQQEIDDKITVSEDEIAATYRGAKDKYFVQREQVQVTDIVLFIDPESATAIEKAKAFRQRIIKEFSNDALKVPVDGTFVAQKNVALNKIVNKKRYDAAKKLAEYGISEPINVDGTLHLVQLTGYKPEISKTLEDAKHYLTNELIKRKKQAAISKWVGGLKDGAKIEIYDMDI